MIINILRFKFIFIFFLVFLFGCSVEYSPDVEFSFQESSISLSDKTYSEFNDVFIKSKVDWSGDEIFIIKFGNLDNVYFVNSDLEKIDSINFSLNSNKFEDKESIKIYGESVAGLKSGVFELDVMLVWNKTVQYSSVLVVEILN